VSAALTATTAAAAPFFLSGTFEITAYNYDPVADSNLSQTQQSNIRRAKSAATEANFNDLENGTSGFANNVTFDVFTYTGDIDFRQGHTFSTSIGDWLRTGNGTVSGLDGFDAGGADVGFAAKTLSAGQGTGDEGGGGSFVTATLFKITASSLNIGNLGDLWNVTHDDGITVLGANNSSVASVGPNSEKTTTLFGKGLDGVATDLTLFYAAANGNPSILEVQAIPLPAAAWLLLGVSGALVAAKRRSARGVA
jgi:hypothetical protein